MASRAAARHEAEPPQEAELLFFASLQMLGLPPTSAQKQAGAVLGPAMFRQPNPKALEFVLHFLFERIRGRDSLKKVGPPRSRGSGAGCSAAPRAAVSGCGTRTSPPDPSARCPVPQELKGIWPPADKHASMEFIKVGAARPAPSSCAAGAGLAAPARA
jgi:hypothetical protein